MFLDRCIASSNLISSGPPIYERMGSEFGGISGFHFIGSPQDPCRCHSDNVSPFQFFVGPRINFKCIQKNCAMSVGSV